MANRMPSTKRIKQRLAYRARLPFFGKSTWWDVRPTGDYFADYETGKQYAVTFWRVCRGRWGCGLDLSEILLAMQEMPRQRPDRGIEVGFIRTIGEVVDFASVVPALVVQSRARLKRDRGKVTKRALRAAAQITQELLDAKHRRDRRRDTEIRQAA